MKAILAFVALFFFFSPAARAQTYPQYYNIIDRAQAQVEAQARHLPLAWMGGYHADLIETSPDHDSEAELTQMAMFDLQGQAVVIFFEGDNMGRVPMIVHAQDHIQDDGPLPRGASWSAPKIVFTNPQVTRTLGRVSRTQMANSREMVINSTLQQIAGDPTALRAAPALAEAIPTASAVQVTNSVAPDSTSSSSSPSSDPNASANPADPGSPEEAITAGMDNEDMDISPEERAFWAWMHKDGVYAGLGLIFFLLFAMMMGRKRS